MSWRTPTREDDELVLRMLALRCAGKTSPVVAHIMGTTSDRVRVITNRVRDEDVTHSCLRPAHTGRGGGRAGRGRAGRISMGQGMSGAAKPLRVDRRTSFPLGSHRVEVLEAEGAVQLRFFIDGFPTGSVCVANIFCDADTVGEWGAIGAYLEGRA